MTTLRSRPLLADNDAEIPELSDYNSSIPLKKPSKSKGANSIRLAMFGSLVLITGLVYYGLSTGIHNSFLNLPEKVHSDPYLNPISSYSSIAEGLEKSFDEPFIVHKPIEFANITKEGLLEKIKNHPDYKVKGFDDQGELVYDLSVEKLVNDFLNDRLVYTVFDSPLQIFDLPKELIDLHDEAKVDAEEIQVPLAQGLVLSKNGTYTALHIDPFQYGGGFMYLWQGEKTWNFLSPEFAPLVFDHHSHSLIDMSPKDFLQKTMVFDEKTGLFPGKAHKDKFRVVTAKANDFVYFPPAWLHRVQTHNKALGLGGYLRPRNCLPHLEEIKKFFQHHGIMRYWDE